MTQTPTPAPVRITSETGGQKEKKLAQIGALDALALLAVAEVAGAGAEKYDRHNFLKGYDWSLSYDALQRHLLLWQAGTDTDDESGQPHLAHAAWHCLALLAFQLRDLGTDDRYEQSEVLLINDGPETAGSEDNWLDVGTLDAGSLHREWFFPSVVHEQLWNVGAEPSVFETLQARAETPFSVRMTAMTPPESRQARLEHTFTNHIAQMAEDVDALVDATDFHGVPSTVQVAVTTADKPDDLVTYACPKPALTADFPRTKVLRDRATQDRWDKVGVHDTSSWLDRLLRR